MTKRTPTHEAALHLPHPSSSSPSTHRPTTPYWIHTTSLFNSKTLTFNHNISLQISPTSGLILQTLTRPSASLPALSPSDLDFTNHTILPGLVDAHTHIFLHAYAHTPSLPQERDESLPARILRASIHCRLALLAGYTTYRDLGTEGLGNADLGVRDSINRGLIPGPRLFVENAMGGTRVPRLSDPCDGEEGCRAGVRRRIGAGADVVKVYAEYRRRALRWPQPAWKGAEEIEFPPRQRNPNSVMWSQREMDVIVEEAVRAKAPVAAHASTEEAIVMACKAGVTSIEHGFGGTERAIGVMKECGVIFVPTLSIGEAELGLESEEMGRAMGFTKKAWEKGVRLACGGDTGAFPHGENARELELMVKAGVPVGEVLRAATLGGWEACGGEWCGHDFGWLGEGWVADLVALEGDLEKEGLEEVIRKVRYVVKDGRVVVADGRIVELPYAG
ncbi:amidohydrolase protein [Rutstroemia sp. NJR-2017a BBW]|nr:amidohydrolase protein [Rutstroemia sp. NJR-2017a BBW]